MRSKFTLEIIIFYKNWFLSVPTLTSWDLFLLPPVPVYLLSSDLFSNLDILLSATGCEAISIMNLQSGKPLYSTK